MASGVLSEPSELRGNEVGVSRRSCVSSRAGSHPVISRVHPIYRLDIVTNIVTTQSTAGYAQSRKEFRMVPYMT